MDSSSHFPTLWDPEELFSHVALWAGVPAGIVIVVEGVLALYQSAKGWKEFADGTAKWVRRARDKGLDITTVRLGIACIGDMTGLRKLISLVGGLVCVGAWVVGVLIGVDALIGFALIRSQDPPPMSLLVTEVITALLFVALGWLLAKISSSSRIAFNARR